MRNSRNFKTAKLGCIAVWILALTFPSGLLVADEKKLAAESEAEEVEAETKVGVGKFFKLPFHISISVRGGYDDNVSTQAFNREGSAFANANVELTYNFGSTRTQLNLATNFGITEYSNQSQDTGSDYNPNLRLSLTHKVSPRLTLVGNAYVTYQQQPAFTEFIGLNHRSGSFFLTSDKVTAAYQWAPRFSTVASYSFVALAYDDSSVGEFEDRTEHYFGNEFRFLVLPTTSLVAEYRFGIIAYANSSAFTRDSTAHFFLGGVDHSFSPRISVSARGGVEIRDYDNFGVRADPYFEGTLLYALGPHLSMSWTNRYSLEEPDVPGAPSRTTFRTSLNARYKLTARTISNLTVFWQHDDNAGQVSSFFVSPPFTEDTFSVTFSLNYAINRNWGVELGYDFADVESDIVFRHYYRNRFYGGLNFQF
jgi:hypothetical protein